MPKPPASQAITRSRDAALRSPSSTVRNSTLAPGAVSRHRVDNPLA
jgi:hypothetical protein